jgi:hypothetical protein
LNRLAGSGGTGCAHQSGMTLMSLMTKVMTKVISAAAVLAAMTAQARADAFEFKDVAGFETCLQLEDLVETVNTADGSQIRFLTELEIQGRCIDSAGRLLSGTKNKDTIMHFVDAVKRLSAPVNSLALIDLVVRLSPPACDDIEVYEVFASALELPDELAGNYLARAKPIVARCLKDKAFRKDFVEELHSRKTHLAAHACDILQNEKIVNSCKGTKP